MQSIPEEDARVLIIDDDKTILKVLSKILQKKGYIVDTAETAPEGLNRLQTQEYDVALIDVKLRDVDGIDLLSQIQKIAPNMKKIMLTGYPSDEDRARALALGADDYLAKPVKSETLVAIIESKLQSGAGSLRASRSNHVRRCCDAPSSPSNLSRTYL